MTRTAYRVGPLAVKAPWGWGGKRPQALLRGWLANRSEWRQRRRRDVQAPVLTLCYVANVYPVARSLVRDAAHWEEHVRPWLKMAGYDDEESKSSSWGLFDDTWFLLDYDRAWRPEDRGWVGGWYYGWQERAARCWVDAKL